MLNEQTIVKWDKNAETDLRNGLTKAQVKAADNLRAKPAQGRKEEERTEALLGTAE